MSQETEHFAKLTEIRREYTLGGLRRENLPDTPIMLFNQWLQQACDAQLPDPTAMCVATVDQQGQPYQRIVLLKHFDEKSMSFYTNLGSRKAQHLQENNRISLHFPWYFLDRQVMVIGRAEKLPVSQVLTYFHSRPFESQIGAWVSKQSSRISGRNCLETAFREMKEKYQQGEVPLPSFWGGYRVNIDAMEFWQGGKHRLHDRFIYQKQDDCWKIDRLAP
ncbi:pyridoxamine 5'-phosphate oxidase [Rosenbergiella australiborealis]|uniref:pyridoxamine 5'-phosphate oxidase n=1 Tax=Rosenbergiella australiborealis TaxID=1544696 RepID=UPI001F4D4CC4|nr:pyridoxamine 5'-phosphate oxidase [Rosenbergiella australiborealis]